MPARVADTGVYHYQLNGEATGIKERWRRCWLASGEWQLSSRRSAPGVEIDVDAHMTQGRITRFEVGWQGDGQQARRAHYRLLQDRVVVNRSNAGEPAECEEMPFSEELPAPLLFPLMRIFTGPLIARLLEQGGSGTVVLPFIGDPAAQSRLLQPVSSERRARVIEADLELELAGARFQCRRCEYLGDQYGPGSEFWLAEDETLVRYQWRQAPQQCWDVWLQRDQSKQTGPSG